MSAGVWRAVTAHALSPNGYNKQILRQSYTVTTLPARKERAVSERDRRESERVRDGTLYQVAH